MPDDTEDAFWGRNNEQGPLSIRTTELAVGLFDHYEVEVKITIYDQPPPKPGGLWEIEAEASLLVESGELGIGDVTSDAPELVISISKGWANVRVFGNWLGTERGQAAQSFYLQIWPKTESRHPTIAPA